MMNPVNTLTPILRAYAERVRVKLSDIRKTPAADYRFKGNSIEDMRNQFKTFQLRLNSVLRQGGEPVENVIKYNGHEWSDKMQRHFENESGGELITPRDSLVVRELHEEIDTTIHSVLLKALPEQFISSSGHFERLLPDMKAHGYSFTMWAELLSKFNAKSFTDLLRVITAITRLV